MNRAWLAGGVVVGLVGWAIAREIRRSRRWHRVTRTEGLEAHAGEVERAFHFPRALTAAEVDRLSEDLLADRRTCAAFLPSLGAGCIKAAGHAEPVHRGVTSAGNSVEWSWPAAELDRRRSVRVPIVNEAQCLDPHPRLGYCVLPADHRELHSNGTGEEYSTWQTYPVSRVVRPSQYDPTDEAGA